jgi:hypothetical protein
MSITEGDFEGKETRICRHPTEPLIAYPSGNSIVVCSPTDPSDAYAYKGHSSPTTTAKFSPNVRPHIGEKSMTISLNIRLPKFALFPTRALGSFRATLPALYESGLGAMWTT